MTDQKTIITECFADLQASIDSTTSANVIKTLHALISFSYARKCDEGHFHVDAVAEHIGRVYANPGDAPEAATIRFGMNLLAKFGLCNVWSAVGLICDKDRPESAKHVVFATFSSDVIRHLEPLAVVDDNYPTPDSIDRGAIRYPSFETRDANGDPMPM